MADRRCPAQLGGYACEATPLRNRDRRSNPPPASLPTTADPDLDQLCAQVFNP